MLTPVFRAIFGPLTVLAAHLACCPACRWAWLAQGGSEELANLRREAAAANSEVVNLGDALDAMSQDTALLNEAIAAGCVDVHS